MAALLVALAVMSLMLSMALPVWHHAAQREREAELIFRGEQYARVIMLYQRQTPGAYPPAVETLVEGRFLRRSYRDPMTAGGEFRLILQSELAEFSGPGAVGEAADDGEPTEARDGPRGQRQGEDVRNRPGFMQGVRPFANRGERTPGGVDGNIAGVVSHSEETSIALYNGQSRYSDWVFLGEGPAAAGQAGGSEETSIALYNGQSRYSDWVFLGEGPAAGQAGGESGQPEPGTVRPIRRDVGQRSGSPCGRVGTARRSPDSEAPVPVDRPRTGRGSFRTRPGLPPLLLLRAPGPRPAGSGGGAPTRQ